VPRGVPRGRGSWHMANLRILVGAAVVGVATMYPRWAVAIYTLSGDYQSKREEMY
jgi:hypothetical protein